MTTGVNRPDPFRLDGRMALVTGATGFLGRAVALGLAEAGATVLPAGGEAARLEPLRQDIEARGARAVAVPLDGADTRALHHFFAGFRAAGGRLDILVTTDSPVTARNWESVRREDFLAAAAETIARPFELARAASPLLEAAVDLHGQAAIINVAAPFAAYGDGPEGVHPFAGSPHTGPAQAGMLQLTRYLARCLGPRGIRVNAVLPGAVPTPAFVAARPDLTEEIKRRVPLGRLGGPDEVARVVRFLAGAGAGYVSGAVIPVDGGRTTS